MILSEDRELLRFQSDLFNYSGIFRSVSRNDGARFIWTSERNHSALSRELILHSIVAEGLHRSAVHFPDQRWIHVFGAEQGYPCFDDQIRKTLFDHGRNFRGCRITFCSHDPDRPERSTLEMWMKDRQTLRCKFNLATE